MRKSSMSATNKSRVVPTSELRTNQSVVHPKKAEGRDLLRSTVRSNYEQTITDLKNRPTAKSNEEEYINGLQEEIKFLEYQLKLLKDKELAERGSLNELDNFLKDEIPINENILAMKNKYNTTKQTLEGQFKKLSSDNEQGHQVLTIQKEEIRKLKEHIAQNHTQYRDRLKQYKDKSSLFSRDMKALKIRYDSMLEDSKTKNEQIKRMNDEMMAIYRQNEKDKVGEVRREDQRAKFAAKLKQDVIETKEKEVTTTIKIEELEQLGDVNPLLAPIDSENVLMKKKLMLNEKQKNTAENRIAEIDLFLDEQAKDRQTERQHKLKLTDQAEGFKIQINNLEKNVEQLLQKQIKYHRTYMTKKITGDIAEKDRLLAFFGDRLKKLEQQSEGLIQDKKELTDNISFEEGFQKEKQNKLRELEKRLEDLKAATDGTIRQCEIVQKDIVPAKNDLDRAQGRIPLVEKEIEKKKEQIEYMNKQVELIKEMKNLNLEEMKLIATGGHQIQESLVNFIKKWEKIKVMSASTAS